FGSGRAVRRWRPRDLPPLLEIRTDRCPSCPRMSTASATMPCMECETSSRSSEMDTERSKNRARRPSTEMPHAHERWRRAGVAAKIRREVVFTDSVLLVEKVGYGKPKLVVSPREIRGRIDGEKHVAALTEWQGTMTDVGHAGPDVALKRVSADLDG